MASKSRAQPQSSKSFRHQTVADDLLQQIVGGDFPVGGPLPTEAQLCARYGLSRFTIRQALDRLVQLGMIERRRGSGTIVVSAAPTGIYEPFASSRADIEALAVTTRLVDPQSHEVVADTQVARRLGTRPGTIWTVLEGVRVRKDRPDVPLCWSEHYTRGPLPASERDWSFTAESIARIRVEQHVRAGILTDDVAKALDARAGDAALIVVRKASEPGGRLLNVGIYTHPGDRYQITVSLEPEA